jgi:hypothetical protein
MVIGGGCMAEVVSEALLQPASKVIAKAVPAVASSSREVVVVMMSFSNA